MTVISTMQRNHLNPFLSALVLGVLFLAGTGLQAQSRILASGHPPLTSEMADQVATFFEWALDVQFTTAQKGEYEAMLVNDWADSSKRKSTLSLLSMLDKLAAASPDTRQKAQATLNRSLVEGMRKEEDSEARWMLAIYDAAHPSASKIEPVAATTGNASAVTDRRLTGKWRSSSAASVQYQNSYTGALAPTSGNSFFYEFLPDGTYHQNGLLQITTYGCTSSVYRNNSGHYRVEGDRLYIEPSQGIVKSHVCGGAPKEKQDSLQTQAYVFHFEPSPNGEVLVVNGVDGKTRPDYYRRER